MKPTIIDHNYDKTAEKEFFYLRLERNP